MSRKEGEKGKKEANQSVKGERGYEEEKREIPKSELNNMPKLTRRE